MSAIGKMRARRARELQAELEQAVRVRTATRGHVATIVRLWKARYARIARAAQRFNAVMPPELAIEVELPAPAELLEELQGALASTWDVGNTLGKLRKLGPGLAKIPAARAQRGTKRKRQEAAAVDSKITELEASYRALARDTATPEGFRRRFLNANAVRKMEGLAPLTEDEYRAGVARYLADWETFKREHREGRS